MVSAERAMRRAAWGSVLALGVVWCAACSAPPLEAPPAPADATPPLWRVYRDALKGAKYVDLTHTIAPRVPVWAGFGPSEFGPALDPKTGKAYTFAKDGFEATRYALATDQLGT